MHEIPAHERIILQWVLHKMSSMESGAPNRGYARWDQWVRNEFGDEDANEFIGWLADNGIKADR